MSQAETSPSTETPTESAGPSATNPPPQSHNVWQLAPDVVGLQIVMVNVYFISTPDGWVLIDTGLPFGVGKITETANQLFGRNARPRAIILTHGHSDHCGGLAGLLAQWGDIPVYAHKLERPYLTGESNYAPGDPTVGGGILSRILPLLPQNKLDFSEHLHELPEDGSVPMLPGWRWLHTPGHTAGHVSFFREADRLLIVGDAFVTRKQESLTAVITNHQHVHGPPKPMTPDWVSAKASVQKLAELNPAIAGSGHGIPMSGEVLADQLKELAEKFDELAVPPQGRYVNHPAKFDEHGVQSVPPPAPDPLPRIAAIVAVAALVGVILACISGSRKKKEA